MNQDCSTCRENGEEDCPDVAGKGCAEWVEHPLFTLGRRAGIEDALQAYRDHAGQSTDAEIARRANAKSKTLVVDKLEALDPDGRQEFIRSATAGGWQLIASRVEAGELVIEVIGAQECAEAAE